MIDRPRWAFIHPFQLSLLRGIESYLWYLAPALARTGVSVDILTWQGPLAARAEAVSSVRLRTVPAFRYYQRQIAVPFYVRRLLAERYDHVFVHFAGYGEGAALALCRDIPYSVVFHFPRSVAPHRYQEMERWWMGERAKHLVAVSAHVADDVQDWCGRPAAVIGHGVDTGRFRPDADLRAYTRTALGIALESPVLVTVAALEERKGVQWGVQALPRVLEACPQAHYIVLGEGGYRVDLEEQIARLGLAQRVHLLGAVADVEAYLAAADVALLLSRGEASPVALLEYAAAGLPVLTSRWPPFDTLVRPPWGERVDEQDAEGVAAAVLRVLARPEERRERGVAGRAWVQEEHTWDQVAQQYRALIG